MRDVGHGRKPLKGNFGTKISWLIVSKAFEKSNKMPLVLMHRLKFSYNCSTSKFLADFVFLPFLNPNWQSVKIDFDYKKFIFWLLRTSSAIFATVLKTEIGLFLYWEEEANPLRCFSRVASYWYYYVWKVGPKKLRGAIMEKLLECNQKLRFSCHQQLDTCSLMPLWCFLFSSVV